MLDVDGVLVHPPAEGTYAGNAALDAAIATVRHHLSAEDWQLLATGRADLLHRVGSIALPAGLTAEALIDYWFESETRIDTAILESVDRLRRGGMRVFLATNQEHLRARYLMDRLGLAAQVDGMLYSAALGYRKPAPEYFAVAALRGRAEAADIVFIDDNEGNVDAARLAGWRATHWLGGIEP